jgi:hypothetical protein
MARKVSELFNKFASSDFVKKGTKLYEPYSSGAKIKKTVKGKFKRLVERLKK